MLFFFRSHLFVRALALSFALFASLPLMAQTALDLGDAEGDPIKLFERGQDAQARKDYQLALRLYEEALKLKPEFPEAEYQRGATLISLNHPAEAEKAFRHAVELRPDWALPHATLGALLLRANQTAEAEKLLARALELDARTATALVSLAARLRWQASPEPLRVLLKLLRGVTESKGATAEQWTARGWTEGALGLKDAALESLQHALTLDANNAQALIARAQLRANAKDYEHALADAEAARRLAQQDPSISLQAIALYLQAGKQDEARRIWETLDEETRRLPEAASLQRAMLSCDETAENRAALEKALAESPRDAQLLVCMGAATRRTAPARSLEFFRRAAEIEPNNLEAATGYVGALVQARRFEDAVVIARRVLAVAPENYEARANLATALYELKRFAEAVIEFERLAAVRPELAATYFFIATAHDFLGEYTEALAAYETFLARADAQTNRLEIEKVNLRLPSLRTQIKRGEGAKQKKGTATED